MIEQKNFSVGLDDTIQFAQTANWVRHGAKDKCRDGSVEQVVSKIERLHIAFALRANTGSPISFRTRRVCSYPAWRFALREISFHRFVLFFGDFAFGIACLQNFQWFLLGDSCA